MKLGKTGSFASGCGFQFCSSFATVNNPIVYACLCSESMANLKIALAIIGNDFATTHTEGRALRGHKKTTLLEATYWLC